MRRLLWNRLRGARALIARNKSDLELGADPFAAASCRSVCKHLCDDRARRGGASGRATQHGQGPGGEAEIGMLTSLRHHEAVSEALAALGNAAEAVRQKVPHEMLLLDLYGP